MKRVLVITYYWPPAGGPGVQRVLKFVKYLPEYGWAPIVLTVRDGEYPSRDPTLEAEVPDGCPVVRTGSLEPGPLYRRLLGQRRDEPIPIAALARDDPSWRSRAAKWVRLNLFVPDAKIGWVPFAVREGRRLIRAQRPDLIFSSSPPSTVQLVAHRLARWSRLPWVADYRDPWTRIFHYARSTRTAWAAARDRRIEQATVAAADVRVAINRIVAEQLAGPEAAQTFHLVPNGFDEEDFPPEDGSAQAPGFTLCYVGNMSSQQNPEALWEAVRALADKNEAFARAFRFVHVGVLDPAIAARLERLGLSRFCDLRGYAPHGEAIRSMRASQLLLLVIPDAPGNEAIVTGKIFEYLAAGRPVLAIGPPGGAAGEILRACSAGWIRAHGQPVTDLLAERFAAWQRGERWEVDKEAVGRYTRRRLTGRLADALGEALALGGKRSAGVGRDVGRTLQ